MCGTKNCFKRFLITIVNNALYLVNIAWIKTKLMTITQLEYVIAVDTHRSFAKAANHCYVSQPALSMQVKKIEEELDVLIFDRSKKPVITTDIGQKIVEHARLILKEVERMHEIIQYQKDEIRGTLRVGIIPTLSPYLVPLFINNFIEKYPDVNLIFEELLSEEIIEKLNTDLLDVGILITPMDCNSVVELPLFYEGFILYGAASEPLMKKKEVSINDLNINDMWLLKHGHCFRMQTINICSDQKAGATQQIKFESGSLETLKKMVESRFGYTLLPELAVVDMDEQKKKNIRHFQSPVPIREVSMVIHRSFVKRRLIESLRDEILNNVPESYKNKNRGLLIQL